MMAQVIPHTVASPDEIRVIAEEAYVYGYPLVLMALTRDVMTTGAGKTPVNHMRHTRTLPDHTFTGVASPNSDTLDSSAWLDLSREPIVLSLPDTSGRYYLMPMLDGWTNAFASLGKRTTGTEKADYAICAPGWKGTLPATVTELRAPGDMVWLLGRTQTNGHADYAEVNALQDQYKLTPLSSWGRTEPLSPLKSVNGFAVDTKTSPIDQVARLDGRHFFGRLAELIRVNPPNQADAPFVSRLSRIGIVPRQSFAEGRFDSEGMKALAAGAREGLRKIVASARQGTYRLVNGWSIAPGSGAFGSDYAQRAKMAWSGLAANLVQDVVYAMAQVDSDGDPLTGSEKYVLHFDERRLPPVNAFWSLTMYNNRQAFVQNRIGRYAIGYHDQLRRNSDGSIDLYLQHRSPGVDSEPNWLPAPRDAFNLILRMYWPRQEVLDATWQPPAVRRIEQNDFV